MDSSSRGPTVPLIVMRGEDQGFLASGGDIWAKMKARAGFDALGGKIWKSVKAGVLAALVAAGGAQVAGAQALTGLARVDAGASYIRDLGGDVVGEFALSQPVPWRLRALADPPRIALDMREADWSGLAGLDETSDPVQDLRAGAVRPGWSRLLILLDRPMLVDEAAMSTEGAVRLALRLRPAGEAEFAAAARLPDPEGWALPRPVAPLAPAPAAGPLVVVLDPGHGGIDPGAEAAGMKEADLMLVFARELKEALLREGGLEVVLTREDDRFVPLEERLSLARAAGAGVFLSLHADALAEGEARGATLYTLSDEATDEAGRALAERHDRDELLAGLDLSGQDDTLAGVLMDMARVESVPRIARLAARLEEAIRAEGLDMHPNPRQEAGFSVLKAPDLPSVLVEIGFLSSARDRERLSDAEWRARMAAALAAGVQAWVADESALAPAP